MSRRSKHAVVSGRVQGVAFRWSTEEKARELGVDGWVRNLFDGRVEVFVEGGPALEPMVAWLREGPRFARVDRVEIRDVEPEDLRGFEVRPSAHG